MTATASGPSDLPGALLWDVDGTLAETERDGHLVAFNQAFAEAGLAWHWSDDHYRALLQVTGGRERILHDMALRSAGPEPGDDEVPAGEAARESLALSLHQAKNRIYAERVAEGLIPLRPGVLALFDACRDQGIPMAITTTTTRASVAALLGRHLGPAWVDRFATLVCAEDVERKKPDPAVFLIAVDRLGLAPARALAIEDSPNGVKAARAAGCPVIVTRSVYFAEDAIDGALAVGPGLDQRRGWTPPPSATARGAEAGIGLEDLADWLAAANSGFTTAVA